VKVGLRLGFIEAEFATPFRHRDPFTHDDTLPHCSVFRGTPNEEPKFIGTRIEIQLSSLNLSKRAQRIGFKEHDRNRTGT
jgi:hypothetical protein